MNGSLKDQIIIVSIIGTVSAVLTTIIYKSRRTGDIQVAALSLQYLEQMF